MQIILSRSWPSTSGKRALVQAPNRTLREVGPSGHDTLVFITADRFARAVSNPGGFRGRRCNQGRP